MFSCESISFNPQSDSLQVYYNCLGQVRAQVSLLSYFCLSTPKASEYFFFRSLHIHPLTVVWFSGGLGKSKEKKWCSFKRFLLPLLHIQNSPSTLPSYNLQWYIADVHFSLLWREKCTIMHCKSVNALKMDTLLKQIITSAEEIWFWSQLIARTTFNFIVC